MTEQQQLEAAIVALEDQRSTLGDAVVESLLSAARAKLAVLTAAGAGAPAQTLRQVSILFLDAVGSTALSQHLDPEAISAVMDDALSRGLRSGCIADDIRPAWPMSLPTAKRSLSVIPKVQRAAC